MKVGGVDHPLQHVLSALSALCAEEKTEKSRKRGKRNGPQCEFML